MMDGRHKFFNRITCVWKCYASYTGSLQSVSFLFRCTRKGPRASSEYSESFATSQNFNHEIELKTASAELWLSLCFSKGILYLLCLSCIIATPFQTLLPCAKHSRHPSQRTAAALHHGGLLSILQLGYWYHFMQFTVKKSWLAAEAMSWETSTLSCITVNYERLTVNYIQGYKELLMHIFSS